MPTTTRPRPAKVTRPKLHDAIPRERLHALLTDPAAGNALWITAPPGAGKTTGVAGTLEANPPGGIWYQVDPGDDDPATLFYYLRLAADGSRDTDDADRLPLFTPEFQYDLPGFARRFIRQFHSRLTPGALVVFDNVQDIPATSVFHDVIVEAIEALPDGIRLIAISREPPPEAYARLVANRRLGRLDWDAVRYSPAETAAIAASCLAGSTPGEAADLHERSGGWAAGLTLLIDQARRGERVADLSTPGNLQEVFDYFASQVFARASAEDQQTLLKLGWLPRIRPAVAAALTGNDHIDRLLDRLYRSQLFTHRRPAEASAAGMQHNAAGRHVYQFHALFQSFLRHRAETTWSADSLRSVRRRCAQLLEAGGEIEDAFDLFAGADDWERAATLLTSYASELLGAGRWKTVLDWTDAMPAEHLERSAALQFWQGMAMSAASPVAARPSLERAFRRASADGDSLTGLLAASALIDTYLLDYTNFIGIDPWIPFVVDPLQTGSVRFASSDVEIMVHCAALNAMTFRRPSHPFREACVERLLHLVRETRDANAALGAIGALLLHAGLTGRITLGRRVEPLFEAAASRPELRPHVVAVAQFALAFHYHTDVVRDRTRVLRCIAELDRIADHHGLPYVQCFADMMRCMLASHVGTEKQSLQAVRALEGYRLSGRPFDVGASYNGLAWHGVWARDPALAIDNADALIDLWMATGSVYHGTASFLPSIWGLRAAGRQDAALVQLQRYESAASGSDMPVLEAGRLAAHAMFALDRGDTEQLDRHLAALMEVTRTHGCMHVVAWVPEWFVTLLPLAVEKGIARDFAAECLERCRGWAFASPRSDEHDARSIHVFTLGRFAVHRDGQPIAFSGKAPRRVLTLLKSIVARGGTDVPMKHLCDDLWADDEGDKAQASLRTALHRLRDFIGDPLAIVVRDSCVSLDPERVWVDVFAFDLASSEVGQDEDALRRTLTMYRGVFLPNDPEAPWAASTRRRCQRHFEQLVLAQGRRLEQAARWGEALELYGRGMTVDESVEAFHRGQMRCLASLGREADALAAYSYLRKILSVRLAAAPSSETSALAEAIRSGQPRDPVDAARASH